MDNVLNVLDQHYGHILHIAPLNKLSRTNVCTVELIFALNDNCLLNNDPLDVTFVLFCCCAACVSMYVHNEYVLQGAALTWRQTGSSAQALTHGSHLQPLIVIYIIL